MSNLKAEVTLDWGDGSYLFRLTVNGLLELEEKCKSAFTEVFQRLMTGTYSISDVRETIRLGLIGGGMEPAKALTLVRRYVDNRPKAEGQKPAQAILGATLFGFEAEPLGKVEAAPREEDPSGSTPPPSTPIPLSLAESISQTLTASRFGSGQPQ
jgi:hypothetical protein